MNEPHRRRGVVVRVIATPVASDADGAAERALLYEAGSGYHEHPGVYAYFGDLQGESPTRFARLLQATQTYGTKLELAVSFPPATWYGNVLPQPVPRPGERGGHDDRHGYIEPSDVDTMLVFDVTHEAGGPSHHWWLSAEPPRGTHPDPAGAWNTLCHLPDDPFAPIPHEKQTAVRPAEPGAATVQGIWRGRWVQATFNRRNDGAIDRWDQLDRVLRPI